LATRISRRELLASAVPALGGIALAAASPFALQGCSVPTGEALDRRIAAALRSAFGVAGAAGQLSRSADMSESEALQLLRGELSAYQLYAITSNGRLTRRFVGQRRARDLRGGRSRYVDGWLLADVEVAVAVVLGF